MLDFALEIDAPADAHCTPSALLQSTIEDRVGRLVFLDQPEPARRIHVVITADVALTSWSARIVMRDDRAEVVGERRMTMEVTRCAEIDEALVVVISTLIGIADQRLPPKSPKAQDTRAFREEHAEGRAPELPAGATVPRSRAAVTSTELRAAQADASRLTLIASAVARADFGLLPGFAPGGSLGLGLVFGSWSLLIDGTLLPRASRDLGSGAVANFMSGVGDVRLCLDAARPFGATLSLCASVEVGVIAVSARGLDVHADRLEPVARGLIGPRLRVPIYEGFGLLTGLDAAVPVLFPRFYFLDSSGERHYYHSMELGMSAQIGMYLSFSS